MIGRVFRMVTRLIMMMIVLFSVRIMILMLMVCAGIDHCYMMVHG